MSPHFRRSARRRAGAFVLAERPLAHRGLHDAAAGIIENSLGAFSAAMEAGFAIECDLQLSADGEAIVFHDDDTERLTGLGGRVKDIRADDLQRLRLSGSDDFIPTLPRLLDHVKGKTPLQIELKSAFNGDDRLVRRVVGLMTGYHGPFGIMSFDPAMIATLRRLAPSMIRGIVVGQNVISANPGTGSAGCLSQTEPDFLSVQLECLPDRLARSFRQAGKPVTCWTIRNPDQARRAGRHADQIVFEGFMPRKAHVGTLAGIPAEQDG